MHFGFSISKFCLKCQISRGRSNFYVTWHGRLHQGKKWHSKNVEYHVCNMIGYDGLTGGLARVQLCWILAKYSPLHHTSCSQIVHVRKLRFRLGGVSFFVASIHLPSCSLRNMVSFVHRHVYERFDHFFENLNGFLNPYSRSSRFLVLNFTEFKKPHSCLKCVVFFKSFPCVICLTRNAHV